MAKLNSKELKRLIAEEWMTDEVVEEFRATYGLTDDDIARRGDASGDWENLSEVNMKGLGLTDPDLVRAFFYEELRTPAHWIRDHKEKLNNLDDYGSIDAAGYIDEELFAKHGHEGAGCWNRIFLPRKDCLADNFRLEIITDPDDKKIVMWTLIVD